MSNALEILAATRSIAQRLAESAEQYLGAMSAAVRPVVRIGGFYRCFDGSLALVARRKTECRCPACSGRAAGTLGLLISAAGIQFAQQGQGGPGGQEPDHLPADECRPGVCRGDRPRRPWHQGIHGEEPGDRFVVDSAGWTLLGLNLNPAQPTDGIASIYLSMAGLSLQTELRAAFTAIEPAEAKP